MRKFIKPAYCNDKLAPEMSRIVNPKIKIEAA